LEYKYKVLTVTTIGIFMAYLDSSIIVVGLPTVIEDLHTSLFTGIWVIAGYALTITVLLVAIGHMADIVGRIKLYNLGFAIFTIGSALCALSQTIEMLILFRLIQATGGALVVVNTLAIITDSFPTSELGKALGINAMSINGGTITGYALSGVMIGLFGWRSIFWLNVPIGVFGVFWCHRRLKEHYAKLSHGSYDYPGAISFSAALTLLLVAMTEDLRDPSIRVLIILSGILFVVFLIHEKRADQPVIDTTLFKIRSFAAGNIAILLNGFALSALAFELTLYLQLVRGFGAFQAGIALLPLDFTMILVSPISGRLSDKYGSRELTAIGLGITSAALFLLANLSLDSSSIFVLASLALAGAGCGLFRSPNATSIMKSAPPELRGIANGVRSTMYNTSIAIGIPLAMALMTVVLSYDKLAFIVNVNTLGNREDTLGLLNAVTHAFYALAFINALGAIASAFSESTYNQHRLGEK
jgi:EmrB/QacA subfamily drug resistance transporter